MQRERVADDIYVFTSERYAQVTAGVVVSSEGAVLIDTLLFPEETRQIQQFVETRLHCPIRYVIYTHYHADHTYGAHLLPEAVVISSAHTAHLLATRGQTALASARREVYELRDVKLIAPHITFPDEYLLRIGNKTLQLWSAPGHSPDLCACLVREDRILFAADSMLPIPHFADGSYLASIETLQGMQSNTFECIVQGHGEIILRGEIEGKIAADLGYLAQIKRYANNARAKADPARYLAKIDVERCGKNRHLLGGLVEQLHQQNLETLFRQLYSMDSSGSTDAESDPAPKEPIPQHTPDEIAP